MLATLSPTTLSCPPPTYPWPLFLNNPSLSYLFKDDPVDLIRVACLSMGIVLVLNVDLNLHKIVRDKQHPLSEHSPWLPTFCVNLGGGKCWIS